MRLRVFLCWNLRCAQFGVEVLLLLVPVLSQHGQPRGQAGTLMERKLVCSAFLLRISSSKPSRWDAAHMVMLLAMLCMLLAVL